MMATPTDPQDLEFGTSMAGDDVPEYPLAVEDPASHSMGPSLARYVRGRVHEYVDEVAYKRIVVLGSYDRALAASRREKTDKLENWQRPNAELRGGDLLIHCFPGRAHVFHHASLIATHLALTGRRTVDVRMTLPTREECSLAVGRCGFASIYPTDIAIVASGNAMLAPSEASWVDYGSFLVSYESINARTVTWFAIKHSFWGDIAYHLGSALANAGFPKVAFVGKLGSLVADHVPNSTIVTGGSSRVRGVDFEWQNLFASCIHGEVAVGRHITLPSVLQESVEWVATYRTRCQFVDPEIGNFAQGVVEAGAGFSYLHMVSDNLARHYRYDLSNEREGVVRSQREQSYRRIGAILRSTIAAL